MIDRILAALWYVRTDPNRIDLIDLLIIAVLKLRPILGGNQARSIVDRPFKQWISGIVVLLRLDIQDQPNPLLRIRRNRKKANIIEYRPLGKGLVLRIQPTNRRCRIIWMYPDTANSRLTFDIFLNNIINRARCKLLDTTFHDPCQNWLAGQKLLAGSIIGRL